jgi:hypothetical protein
MIDYVSRGEPTTIGTVMEHTRIDAAARERFLQTADDELTKFERQDAEFRKRERQERAAKLRLPLDRALSRD